MTFLDTQCGLLRPVSHLNNVQKSRIDMVSSRCTDILAVSVSALTSIFIASFPGPAQPFVTCGTEKQGEPGIFLSEHDAIDKWKKIEQKTKISCIVQPTTTHSMIGVYDSHPPLAGYVFLLFWAPVHPCSIKSFLILFYPWHHTCKKDTRPSASPCNQKECGPGNG